MGDPIAKIIKMGGRIKQKKVPTTAYEITKQQKREYCERNNILHLQSISKGSVIGGSYAKIQLLNT